LRGSEPSRLLRASSAATSGGSCGAIGRFSSR
jgi:hypothetical protein